MNERSWLSKTTRLRLAEVLRGGAVEVDPRLGISASVRPIGLQFLLHSVGQDLDSTFDRMKRLFVDLADEGIPDPTHLMNFDHSLVFAGYAEPAGSSTILGISAGAVLSIEELLLLSLTDVDFFTFPELVDGVDATRTNAPIEVQRVEGQRPELSSGFQWLRGLGEDLGDALLTSLPVSPWRLCQFELLRDLAVQWLCLHEASHWMRGHVAFIQLAEASFDLPAWPIRIGMSDGASSGDIHPQRAIVEAALRAAFASSIPADLAHRCLEHQADHMAFGLLARLHHHQTDHPDSAFARYAAAMHSLNLTPQFDALLDLTDAQRLRAMLIAAQVAILFIEKIGRAGPRNVGYPFPMGRFLHLQLAAAAEWPIAGSDEEGAYLDATDADEEELRQFLRDALGNALIDIDRLGRNLRLEPMTIEEASDGRVFGPVIREVLRLFDPDTRPSDLETEAGRELHHLQHEQNPIVDRILAPFQIFNGPPTDEDTGIDAMGQT